MALASAAEEGCCPPQIGLTVRPPPQTCLKVVDAPSEIFDHLNQVFRELIGVVLVSHGEWDHRRISTFHCSLENGVEGSPAVFYYEREKNLEFHILFDFFTRCAKYRLFARTVNDRLVGRLCVFGKI